MSPTILVSNLYFLFCDAQLDLHKKMHENEEMSKTYHQLQNEYLKLKAEALKVIEIKLQMETSLRDYEQVHY